MSPLESNPIFLTGNTDTVYGSVFFDLSKTGPLVINIPAGLGPGTINDAFFRFVADTGAPGPDRGKGGKYLSLVPVIRSHRTAKTTLCSVLPHTQTG